MIPGPSVYNSVRPVRSIADMRGCGFACSQFQFDVGHDSALARRATSSALWSVLTALATKLIDGAENNWPFLCHHPITTNSPSYYTLHRAYRRAPSSGDVAEGLETACRNDEREKNFSADAIARIQSFHAAKSGEISKPVRVDSRGCRRTIVTDFDRITVPKRRWQDFTPRRNAIGRPPNDRTHPQGGSELALRDVKARLRC